MSICPYPGLRPFNENEAIFFKGRDHHILTIQEELVQSHYLMVTGASGDGKSSLVYAGLLPNVKAGFVRGKYARWNVSVFKPTNNPLGNLVEALVEGLDFPPEKIAKELKYGYSALVDLYLNSSCNVNDESLIGLDEKERKKALKDGRNLLVVVDQFEEFFTNAVNFDKETAAPSNDAATVVNLLVETARISKKKGIPIYIICTMRSDYIGNAPAYRGLPELIGDYQFFVPRLNREDIEIAISEPSVLNGGAINPRLTQRLLTDLDVVNTDLLPSLQHCLRRIWEAANNGTKTLDLIHYAMAGGMKPENLPEEDHKTFNDWFDKQDEITKSLHNNQIGISNVLNMHANLLYETAHLQDGVTVSKEEAQRVQEVFFRSLTKIDENRAVRNLSSFKELLLIVDRNNIGDSQITAIINIYRLPGNTLVYPYITNDNDLKLYQDDVIDISHEALIRNWSKLKEWTKDEFNDHQDFKETSLLVNRWVNNNKADADLLSEGAYKYLIKSHVNTIPTIGWIARYLDTKLLLTDGGTEQDLLEPQEFSFEGKEDKAREFANMMQEFYEKSRRKIAKRTRIKIAITVLLSIMVILLGISNYNSNKAKERVQQISDANAFATKALMLADSKPLEAKQLAIKAYEIHQNDLTQQALYNSLFYAPKTIATKLRVDRVYDFDKNRHIIIVDSFLIVYNIQEHSSDTIDRNCSHFGKEYTDDESVCRVGQIIYFIDREKRVCKFDLSGRKRTIITEANVEAYQAVTNTVVYKKQGKVFLMSVDQVEPTLLYSYSKGRGNIFYIDTSNSLSIVINDFDSDQLVRIDPKGNVLRYSNIPKGTYFNVYDKVTSRIACFSSFGSDSLFLLILDSLFEIESKTHYNQKLMTFIKAFNDGIVDLYEMNGQGYFFYYKGNKVRPLSHLGGGIRNGKVNKSGSLFYWTEDGRLILYDASRKPIYSLLTSGKGPVIAAFINDSQITYYTKSTRFEVTLLSEKLHWYQLTDGKEEIKAVSYINEELFYANYSNDIRLFNKNKSIKNIYSKNPFGAAYPLLKIKDKYIYADMFNICCLNSEELDLKSVRKWKVPTGIIHYTEYKQGALVEVFGQGRRYKYINLDTYKEETYVWSDSLSNAGADINGDVVTTRTEDSLYVYEFSSKLRGVIEILKDELVKYYNNRLYLYSLKKVRVFDANSLALETEYTVSDLQELTYNKKLNLIHLQLTNGDIINVNSDDFTEVGKFIKPKKVTITYYAATSKGIHIAVVDGTEIRIYDSDMALISSWYMPSCSIGSIDVSYDEEKILVGTSTGRVLEYYLDKEKTINYFKE